ncbi:MAG: hypothetical protein C0463_08850 [Idiomarina sp.]|nr:hypothetical protein [Idiomarina sp.]
MRNTLPLFTIGVLSTAVHLTAHANGGHFLVDDADITPPGECALEVWAQRASASAQDRVDQPNATHSVVAQPLCTTRNGWEIGIPLEYNTSESELASYGLELKTMLSGDLYGGALALSIGAVRDQQLDSFEGAFINLPYSRELNESAMLHINLGSQYDSIDSQWRATWGAAATVGLTSRFDLIAETAGVGRDSPAAALGLRSVLSSRVELDASFGRDFEVRSNLVAVGLNIAL